MWSMDVCSKVWLSLSMVGLNPSLREEGPSLGSGSRRWRQSLHGMGCISHRFTTPMDQWRTKPHCQTEWSRVLFSRDGETTMGTDVMMGRIAETWPRFEARITGAIYLFTILTGIFAQGFVSGSLVVDGDAAATATNILTHRGLFQLGFAVYLIEMACQIAMTALFYELLRPAGRSVSLLAAYLGLAGCAIKTFSRVFFIAPLFVLGGPHYLSVFSTEQLQALALLFLKVNDQGAGIALVFFGFYALLTGFLVIRSTFLPRFLGVLGILGGVCWLIFLYPPLGYRLFPIVVLLGVLGSGANILWLLVFGVNEQRG